MDPNACLNRIIGALVRGAEYDARDAYIDLTEWIRRGGFAPHAFDDRPVLAAAYRRGFNRFAAALMDEYGI